MNVLENKPLSNYSSMCLGGPANFVIEVSSEDEILKAAHFSKEKNVPIITLGEGTNVVFKDSGFNGVVLINKLRGITINADGTVVIAGGEDWDSAVAKIVSEGFAGVEALSLIPGTAGATPVNNIGAYGQEIADVLVSVKAFDTKINDFVTLKKSECGFAYRTSRFKNEDHGRFIIIEIMLKLSKPDSAYKPPLYPALASKLAELGIESPTILDVRNAVIEIRRSKLPDPNKIANSGSFFKNPIVSDQTAQELIAKFPDMPVYPTKSGTKLAAGWLIEKAGLKNHRQNGMWIYDKQALVLVNENAHSFKDLQIMIDLIKSAVKAEFGVELEPEPEIL